ncbi:MAG: site-2 protease family protein [Nitrospirota bacterium]
MDIRRIVVSILPILIAITFHEVAHGFIANKLGDPTAKATGRLTLNPIAHIDLIGTIFMPLALFVLTQGQFIFGYAKPVPINPMNFKNPKKDMAISAAAGPVMNLIIAALSLIISEIIARAAVTSASGGITVMEPLRQMFEMSFEINVILAAINLLPIPPLDGGRILVGILPHEQAVSYSRIEPFGFIIVIILYMTGIAGYFIIPLIHIIKILIAFFAGLLLAPFLELFKLF